MTAGACGLMVSLINQLLLVNIFHPLTSFHPAWAGDANETHRLGGRGFLVDEEGKRQGGGPILSISHTLSLGVL